MNAEVYPALQFPTSEVNKNLSDSFFSFSQSCFIFTVKALSTCLLCHELSPHPQYGICNSPVLKAVTCSLKSATPLARVGGCDPSSHLPVLWPRRFRTSTIRSNDFTTRDWKTLWVMFSKTVVSLCEHSSSSCSTGQQEREDTSEEEVKSCRRRRSLPVLLKRPHTTVPCLALWHFSLHN